MHLDVVISSAFKREVCWAPARHCSGSPAETRFPRNLKMLLHVAVVRSRLLPAALRLASSSRIVI